MAADLPELILAAVISGGVASVLLGLGFRYFFEPRLLREAEATRSVRERKEQALSEVLGPIVMQLERSNRAFGRWESRNDFLEGKVVKEANTQIRDLLLAKGHLLPPHLLSGAADLIELRPLAGGVRGQARGAERRGARRADLRRAARVSVPASCRRGLQGGFRTSTSRALRRSILTRCRAAPSA